jgi:hypothetical protein
VLAAGVAALVAGVAGCGGKRAELPSAAATPSHEIKDHFGVFRRPVRPEDALRLSPGGTLEAAVGPRYGVDFGQARRLRAYSPSVRFWVAPGRDSICTFVQPPGASGPGGGCSPVSKVEVGASATTITSSPDHVEVFGLVPDGVTRVELQLADGSTQSISVEENAYSVLVHATTRSVSFDGTPGHVRVDASSYTE